MKNELTISEILLDPLIALLNAADGVHERSFAQLMQSAARIAARTPASLLPATVEPRAKSPLSEDMRSPA
ncbi:hypothetical protein ASC90_25760 [Rhizobium sp. Root1220]|nr:hypothetical protein ASC90_25760 [Rhizobium sp. Root1220]